MRRHAALPVLFGSLACGGNALDVGNVSGTGGESGGSVYLGAGGAQGKGGTANGDSSQGGSAGQGYAGSTVVGPGGSTMVGLGGSTTVGAGGSTSVWDATQLNPKGTFVPVRPPKCDKSSPVERWAGNTGDAQLEPQRKWHLRLIYADDGTLCGLADYVGSDEVTLPVATDPNANYPTVPNPAGELAPWPGMVYSIIEGAHAGNSVRFRVAGGEVWSDWCQLQTAYTTSSGYNCVPDMSRTFRSGDACYFFDDALKEQTVSLEKCDLCFGGVCACSATGCEANDILPVHFDLTRQSEGILDGTISNGTTTWNITFNLVAI